MHAKFPALIAFCIVAAGVALSCTGIASAQSRDAEPALLPGEQAININASAFISADPTRGGSTSIDGKSSSQIYYAALQLPDGTTIKQIGFWGMDFDNGSWIELRLLAQDNKSDTLNEIKTVETSLIGASNAYQFFHSPRFRHVLRGTRSYLLYLYIQAKSSSAPNEQKFLFARVIYEPAL